MNHATSAAAPLVDMRRNRSEADISAWIVSYLSRLLELPESQVSADARFEQFGMDSAATVGLTGDLSDWLNIQVDPTLAYDYPNIESLSARLASMLKEQD